MDPLEKLIAELLQETKAVVPKPTFKPGEIFVEEDHRPQATRGNYVLESGQELINVHSRSVCEDQPCAIHHASEHNLSESPRSWQDGLIFRLCEHGFSHPDYDSVAIRLECSGSVSAMHDCCAFKCCGMPEVLVIHA